MKSLYPLLLAGLLVLPEDTRAGAFPVTVESCGRPVSFEQPPRRAVVHDLNLSEMLFALELQPYIVSLTGITGWYQITPEFAAAMDGIPELAPKYPTLENLLGADPDFFFAGWYYGMQPGGEVTPETLTEYGIPVYELSESCAHLDAERPRATLDLLYDDVHNLGRIFGYPERAERLITDWRERVARVGEAVAGRPRPRVFLFDSGEESPFSAGRLAMPTALIEAAGGYNILDDVAMSWGRVGWESVVDHDPEFIILVGYQDDSWRERWDFLRSHPAMATTRAVREERFQVLGYTEITPGPANIAALEALAEALHPDAF